MPRGQGAGDDRRGGAGGFTSLYSDTPAVVADPAAGGPQIIYNDDEDYPAVKLEHQIAYYHQPQTEWEDKLRLVRNSRSGGDPLWWGKPK